MSDPNSEHEFYDWDWRDTPEWREVEKAIANLMKLDEEAGNPMVTDFVMVVASVPGDIEAKDLLGVTNIFASSRQPYIPKGLLAEGIELASETGEI